MRPKTYDANTASTYAMVGLIFFIFIASGVLISIIFAFFVWPWPFVFWNPSSPVFVLSLVGLGIVLTLIFAIWAYLTYKKIEEGKYTEARTSALILGTFGLFFGGFIGGLFFLLAYGKLGDVLKAAKTPPSMPSQPLASGNLCVSCGQVVFSDYQYCPNCGIKLSK